MSTRLSARTNTTRMTTVIRNISLASLFRPEDILHECQAEGDEEVVHSLLLHLALEHGIGNFKAAQEEVMANMRKDSPHISPGVAVIYAKLEKISSPLVAIATFSEGRVFAGERVFLVVSVLIPPDLPGVYKQIVTSLSKACGKDGVAETIAKLPSPLATWQHFEEGGHKLPDHLKAKHIMSAPSVHLKSDDNLSRAIDLFLTHRVAELPVLDPAGELIGVVSTRRLVKICMPDYLMWIADMRPFQNFEPIAEIIRRASSTWLREIMTHDFAHVDETSPAILALREIARCETDSAYVLRGRTLVGVIHLHEFLDSILR